MSLNPEIKEAIAKEEQTLAEVLASLKKQLAASYHRLNIESSRARELTSELTNSSRDEDKHQLSSDEAVSHQLAKNKGEEVRAIDSLLDRPYFARIQLKEQDRIIEYKLGIESNLDCRIIDWRNAPIAKLFYEYQEGEEYEELIQGRERFGVVELKNKVEIAKSKLTGISCRHGKFVSSTEGWKEDSNAKNYGKGGLRPILNLITADQFRLITEDADRAVLLQGVAGSGKTTVALHRLAWLLHEKNSEASSDSALVLVASEALRRYVHQTLPKMGVEGVSILTFSEWARSLLAQVVQRDVESVLIKNPPLWASRVKRSHGIMEALKLVAEKSSSPRTIETYQNALRKALSNRRVILENDDTNLLDNEVLDKTLSWSESCFEQDRLDSCDLSLFLLFYFYKDPEFFKKNSPVSYLVVDEIQDLSPAELTITLHLAEKQSSVTLVGDTAQQITVGETFSGWDAIRKVLESSDTDHHFTTLDMSHRSTLPIMRLADSVLGDSRTAKGRPGKKPIWFVCRHEDSGISQVVSWLTRVTEKYPGQATAVICPDLQSAKFARSILEPTFGNAINFCEDNDFSYEHGISITHVGAAKGLEFSNVLIWNPSKKAYPAHELGKNYLYTAITRAAELLCIVTWSRPSRLLPAYSSPLIRVHRMDEDFEKPSRKPKKLFD